MDIITTTTRSSWWGSGGRREKAREVYDERELLVRGVWKYLTVTRRQWAPRGAPCVSLCCRIYTKLLIYVCRGQRPDGQAHLDWLIGK